MATYAEQLDAAALLVKTTKTQLNNLSVYHAALANGIVTAEASYNNALRDLAALAHLHP